MEAAAQMLAAVTGGLAITGPSATRRAFLTEAGRYRIVCFLGHAYFDRRRPLHSRMEMTDGPLRAAEILRDLDLDADLVILAACETGRGRVLRGDEIMGLTRALLYAGARSLLVTLWPVHEVATRLLVERLVHRLTSGLADVAQALGAAQLWLRALTYDEALAAMANWDDLMPAEAETQLMVLWRMTNPDLPLRPDSPVFAHPFFWSPWVLVGEPHIENERQSR